MVARLERFPKIKGNFNLVPCLIEQILDYAGGDVQERYLELARKPAGDLTDEDKVFVIQHFFLGNRKTMIEPHTRYRSLFEKCIDLGCEHKVLAALKGFKTQDYLDLQVWSNLAWIGPALLRDPRVSDLVARQRGFTEKMKSDLLAMHMEVMGSVLGRYRALAEAGRIEVSMSPYFHPILPILCDSDSARHAAPAIGLPSARVQFPEDAKAQIFLGQDLHREVFGAAAKGMWPPEGAVSDQALRLACECGIRWAATDEGILEATAGVRIRDSATGKVLRPDLLYHPHSLSCDGGEVVVFFRDRVLSDLISFAYSKQPAKDAVRDFMGRLETIRRDLGPKADGALVLVALDGENCWEFYDRGGDGFLEELYTEMSDCGDIRTVLLSDVVEGRGTTPSLKSIYPGSWVGNSLETWIGHPEDHRAWELLIEARSQLEAGETSLDQDRQHSAWRSIYAAEGSDWFWWYGEEHASREDPEFDALFRAHIRHVFESVGAHVPHKTLEPIMAHRRTIAIPLEPAAVIRPLLDGRVTTFYEWKLAGLYESYRDGIKGLATCRLINAIYFGFDHNNLFLRLDTSISPQAGEFTDLTLNLEFEDPVHRTISLRAAAPRTPGEIALEVKPADLAGRTVAVALETVEICVPFAAIPAVAGNQVSMRVSVERKGQVVERRPIHDMLSLKVPTADFEAENWSTL
jgi:alpha-amylase/alpha-mannosidase (GH57 family)